ncbi:Oligosaccharide translocation protein RFT1 [Pleurostoma richardsiae]|uniref:Man(5)GlcNAc(2)-PP-dolichol translocation protein RFT1 n=1 Tax=Pleurostoma richardsiae TaxID=41990 RepID=A0AA38SBP8_9PEZI|nr:Oligosaccharide translocation protein RFT1 [Pleurostoma richardsiae]
MSEKATKGGGGVLRGASLLILLQVVSRALTFIANQILLRFLTAQLLGISTQLEVYYLSVLFFARESLRVAIQRQGSPSTPSASSTDDISKDVETERKQERGQDDIATEAQAAVNLAYVSVALGILVAGALGWMYLSSVTTETVSSAPYVVQSLYIYALAAFLELLSEPAFVIMQLRLQFGARASAESVATIARCTATLGSAVWASRNGLDLGVLPFALGQLGYGLSLLVVYTWFGLSLASREGFSMVPSRLQVALAKTASSKSNAQTDDYAFSYFHRPTLQLASSMMAQSLVKHVLTQGDTFLVSVLSTPTAQGVYALANNYGGLVARLVLQPIEESSRSYFSRLLSNTTASSSLKEKQPAANTGTKSIQKAASDLRTLLKLYILLSLPITALGPTAAPLALSLIAGPRWAGSGAGTALAAYVWYIPLLALNGVAEAFVASVATESEVHRQSVWMGGFSLTFAIAGVVFLRLMDLGAVGLVLANGINMLCRIAWCEMFIAGYFGRLGVSWDVKDLLPSPLAVLAAAVTSQAARSVVGDAGAILGAKQLLFELIKVAGIAVPFMAALAFAERDFLLRCYRTIRGTQTASP